MPADLKAVKPVVASLLLGGLSGACSMAAVGVALYAQSPTLVAAGALFAAVGFATGVACMAVPMVMGALPAQARLAAGLPQPTGPSPLSSMARATLAVAQQPAPRAEAEAKATMARELEPQA